MALPPESETRQYLQYLEGLPLSDFALDPGSKVVFQDIMIAGRTWRTLRSNASSSGKHRHLNIVIQVLEEIGTSTRNTLHVVIYHNDDTRPLSKVTGALFKALLVKGVDFLATSRIRMVQLSSDFEGVNELWNGEDQCLSCPSSRLTLRPALAT